MHLLVVLSAHVNFTSNSQPILFQLRQLFTPSYFSSPMFVRHLATAASSRQLRDVVIIGGGPAGLSLLASLKNSPKTRHLNCTLVEAGDLSNVRNFTQNPPPEYTNRVVSLTPKSIEFMRDNIGSWDLINTERVKFYDTIIAYDGQDVDSRILFDASATESGVLAAMCENINIQSSLLAKIDQLGQETGLEILDNTKVTDISSPVTEALHHSHSHADMFEAAAVPVDDLDWPVIELSSGELLQARLLVGADGYNSPVRKFARIESRGWNYDRFGVVATIKLQFEDYRSIGWQRFLSTGPLAILPLTEDNATIVWLSTPELADVLLKCDETIFPHLVSAGMVLEEVDLQYIYGMLKEDPSNKQVLDEIAWRLSKVKVQDLETKYPFPVVQVVPGSRAKFPLKMTHADTYIAPRIALVGDAAHTIHPLAGQGLNMGQSDVAALMTALESGVDRGLDIGSTLVLENYSADAWPSNHVLLGVCDKLHKIFAANWGPFVALRGFGMKSLNSLGSLKDLMIKQISG